MGMIHWSRGRIDTAALVGADGGWAEWPDDGLEVDDEEFARAIAAGRAVEADHTHPTAA